MNGLVLIHSLHYRQAAPAVTALDSTNFEEFKNSDRVVVIGYASDEDSKAELKVVADKLRDDYFFGIVTDEALAKEHSAKVPSIVIYKQFDEGRNDLEGELESDKIEEFVKTNSIPLFDEIDASNFKTYADAGLPLAYIFSDDEDATKSLVKVATPFAQKYKGKINFVTIDANKYSGHAGNVGLKEQWPAFSIQNLDNGAKYPLDQSLEINSENLDKFLEQFASGNMKPTLKSGEAPADNNGPVKVIVADQFNELVLDKSKDVFLEVYAPWCGHCKRLEPVWTQLGEQVSKLSSDIVIAKMDGTENDIPEEGQFEVTGFPTLKFFKADTNELIDYDGDRSMEDLTKFLNEHNSKGIKLSAEAPVEEAEKDNVNTHDEL
jgi:protein disulfide-isomerase A1